LDSTGRAYALPAHSLPSARGQGEPLSGRINPPDGATFKGVLIGEPDEYCLLSCDAGYGFVARLEDLYARNRAGKLVLSLPEGANVLPPCRVHHRDDDRVAAISTEGHLLVHRLRELPTLARGKGVKILQIPTARLKTRQEYVKAIALVPAPGTLTLHAGKRHLSLRPVDLDQYELGRARRGRKLPRGLQHVDSFEVEP
jgi:topoisomerase-4 subunit A